MKHIRPLRVPSDLWRLLKVLGEEGVRCWSTRTWYTDGAPTTRQFWLWAHQKPAPDRDPEWGTYATDERVLRLVAQGLLDGTAADAHGDRIDYAVSAKGRAALAAGGVLAPAVTEEELFDQPGVSPWRMQPDTYNAMDDAA